tara:strand:- start:3274 stop:3573 length:300 start_codon:yes stop_codon:yes gene_type:complete
MSTNVKLIRIVTGEEIVADLLEDTGDTITIKNALVVFPNQQQVGFAPWCTVLDRDRPEITIKHSHVVYIAEVDTNVTKKYTEVFGGVGIVTPEEKKIII